MSWYLQCWKKYLVFGGRARRSEYWYFWLFNIIASFIIGFADGMAGANNLLILLYSLASILPGLGVMVRRLHDTDHSGWWFWVGLIPIVGSIILLVLLVSDSTPGNNRFGPNPKAPKPGADEDEENESNYSLT